MILQILDYFEYDLFKMLSVTTQFMWIQLSYSMMSLLILTQIYIQEVVDANTCPFELANSLTENTIK